MEIPKHHIDFVGTKKSFGGGLFSGKKELEFEEYDVLDWRWGSAQIWDTKNMIPMHPTIEYLLKKDGMRASRWTRPFPVREIQLEAEDE